METEMQSKTVEVPKDVAITVTDKTVRVKGPKGELARDFNNPIYSRSVIIESSSGLQVKFENKRTFHAAAGTIAAHVRNMILGVTIGFEYRMKIVYSHFPVNASIKDNELHVKNFLGEKGARIARIPQGCSVKVDKDEIVISGIDIEKLGQAAQRIEQTCRLSGRDRRVFQDGIFLVSRALQNGEKI